MIVILLALVVLCVLFLALTSPTEDVLLYAGCTVIVCAPLALLWWLYS